MKALKELNYKDVTIHYGAIFGLPELDALDDEETGNLLPISSGMPASELMSVQDYIHICRVLLFNKQTSKDHDQSIFNDETLVDFLLNLRLQNVNIYESLYEYNKFRSLGFNHWNMDNQLALIIIAADNKELLILAENLFTNAATTNSNSKFVELNLALCKIYLGKYLEAYKIFKKYESYLKTSTNFSYLLGYAKASLEVVNLKLAKIAPNKLQKILLRALEYAKTTKRGRYVQWWKEIIEASKA